jgi:hypothetical protein
MTYIYLIASEWAQKASVLHYTRLKWLASGKHSSLLGPFVTYKENKVLSVWLPRLFLWHFIYVITSEWAQKASVLHNTRLKRLTSDKQPSLLGPYVSYIENKVLSIWLPGLFLGHFIYFITYKWVQWWWKKMKKKFLILKSSIFSTIRKAGAWNGIHSTPFSL